MDHLRLKPLLFSTVLLALPAYSAPLLTCKVSYAGTTHTVLARPVIDPYPVPSADIGGRFLFKPVMVGTDKRIEYIKLYTYLDAGRQPVLVQLAKYLPPFARTGAPPSLTGDQTVYAGPVERELHYRCALEGVSQ